MGTEVMDVVRGVWVLAGETGMVLNQEKGLTFRLARRWELSQHIHRWGFEKGVVGNLDWIDALRAG